VNLYARREGRDGEDAERTLTLTPTATTTTAAATTTTAATVTSPSPLAVGRTMVVAMPTATVPESSPPSASAAASTAAAVAVNDSSPPAPLTNGGSSDKEDGRKSPRPSTSSSSVTAAAVAAAAVAATTNGDAVNVDDIAAPTDEVKVFTAEGDGGRGDVEVDGLQEEKSSLVPEQVGVVRRNNSNPLEHSSAYSP